MALKARVALAFQEGARNKCFIKDPGGWGRARRAQSAAVQYLLRIPSVPDPLWTWDKKSSTLLPGRWPRQWSLRLALSQKSGLIRIGL